MDTTYYYNETLKKYIKIFGALFSNYKIYHGEKEIRIPIVYGHKSKMYVDKIQNSFDEDKQRPGEILLPVMSYRLTNIEFDIERKTPNTKIYDNSAENDIDFIFMPKPFNLNFELYVWTKYENDMYQILEQLLYCFSSKIIISTNIFPSMSIYWDMIMILNDNTDETENYEYGQDNTLKEMKWRLNFTIKGFLFSNTIKEKLIKKVTVNYKEYDKNNEIDPESILQEEIYEVNPFDSLEEDDYNIKLTKTINNKIYITFMGK